MKYFLNCKDLDQVKAKYRELAKQYHPDLNPEVSDDIMKQINSEYDFASANLVKGVKDESLHFEAAMNFKEQINRIIHLPGISIEIVGAWIWVTGNTRPVKAELKEAGYWWASQKLAWYWYPSVYGGGRGKSSLDELRSKYGSEKIYSNSNYLTA